MEWLRGAFQAPFLVPGPTKGKQGSHNFNAWSISKKEEAGLVSTSANLCLLSSLLSIAPVQRFSFTPLEITNLSFSILVSSVAAIRLNHSIELPFSADQFRDGLWESTTSTFFVRL
jgi:hypothetical protein